MKKRELFYGAGAIKNTRIIPCAWDCETEGLGGELLCITASTDREEFYVAGDDTDQMIFDFLEMLFKSPSGNLKASKDKSFIYPKLDDGARVYYAHNAQYDLRYILRYLVDHDYKIKLGMRSDVDIYQVVIYRDEKEGAPFVMFRDSFALYPSSLNNFTNEFSPGTAKLEGAISHSTGEIFDRFNPLHVEYAKRDSLSLRLALSKYFEVLMDDFHVTPAGTAAGTALKAWQATVDGRIFASSLAHEKFFRSGYYGGLVFLTTTESVKFAECYDINSSYPAHMRSKGVPHGKPIRATKYVGSEKMPGMFRVVMRTTGDVKIPIIPSRDDKGSIAWVSGEFETTVTNYEIDFALKHGYEIVRVLYGYVWEKVFYPFDDFVNKCERLRGEHKGTAREKVTKLMQNSVYGKFATSRDRRAIYHPEQGEVPTGQPLNGIHDPKTCDAYFYIRKEETDELLCKVEFAAFITAHARLTLLEGAYSIGVENVLYGDTDSLTVRSGTAGGHLDIGTAYGQFKLEKIWSTFRASAPKTYAGEYDSGYVKRGVKYGGAVKGLSKKEMTQAKWKELLLTGRTDVDYLSLDNLIKTIKTGTIDKARKLNRKSSDLKNSRHFNSSGDIVTVKRANRK